MILREHRTRVVPCEYSESLYETIQKESLSFRKRPDGEPYEKWRPILDEKFITEYPTKAFVDGKFARVPMIVG